jgi:hypothetical protein
MEASLASRERQGPDGDALRNVKHGLRIGCADADIATIFL